MIRFSGAKIFFPPFAVSMGVWMEDDRYLMVCYNCGHGTYRRGEDVYDMSPRQCLGCLSWVVNYLFRRGGADDA